MWSTIDIITTNIIYIQKGMIWMISACLCEDIIWGYKEQIFMIVSG